MTRLDFKVLALYHSYNEYPLPNEMQICASVKRRGFGRIKSLSTLVILICASSLDIDTLMSCGPLRRCLPQLPDPRHVPLHRRLPCPLSPLV